MNRHTDAHILFCERHATDAKSIRRAHAALMRNIA